MSGRPNDDGLVRWEGLREWGNRPDRQRWIHRNVLFPEYATLLESCPHDTILDYGCGDGSLAAYLFERFPHSRIIAFDEAANMRALARAELFGIDVPDSLGDEVFDVICANMVIQDVNQPQELLTALAGRLTATGLIIVSVPHPVFSLVEDNHRTTRRERLSPAPVHDLMRYPYEETERVYWSDDQDSWTYLHNRTIQTYSELFLGAGLALLRVSEPRARDHRPHERDLFDVFGRVPGVMFFVCSPWQSSW